MAEKFDLFLPKCKRSKFSQKIKKALRKSRAPSLERCKIITQKIFIDFEVSTYVGANLVTKF